jgi:hypothetical protein
MSTSDASYDPDQTPRHRSGEDAGEAFEDDHRAVVAREREAFGGIKIGSAFFGWLTATGTAVLLTSLVVAAGAVVSLATDTDPVEAATESGSDTGTIGIIGGLVLLAVLFVSYYCGGYVAGRMARFDGAKQGLAVWTWAVVMAIVLAILGAVAGEQFNVLSQLNTFPRVPVDEGDLTTAGIVAAVAVVIVSLLGAVLGGLAGMRFHRKVDRAALDL